MSENEVSKTAMQVASSLATEVYKDGLQPSVKSIGEALAGIFKAVGHYPRYWGMMSDISLDHKQKEFEAKLEAKVNAIPDDQKVLPKPNILGPTIQALEYGVLEDHMSEMFANLLASSMNSKEAQRTHPSFVEIIKQLTGDEAKLLFYMKSQNLLPIVNINRASGDDGVFTSIKIKYHPFAKTAECDQAENYQEMIENLERLRLIEVQISNLGGQLSDIELYEDIRRHAELNLGIKIKSPADKSSTISGQYFLNLGYMNLTAFGSQFIEICCTTKE